MTIEKLRAIFIRQWPIFLFVFLLSAAAVFAFRDRLFNTYVGVAHVLLVSESGARDTSVSIVDLPSIATSTVVLDHVKTSLNLATSLVDLKKQVSARVVQRSSILEISYRDESPLLAMAVTNGVADELARYYSEISGRRYDENVSSLTRAVELQKARFKKINDKMRIAQRADAFVISDKSTDDVTERADDLETQRGIALASLTGSKAMADTDGPSPTLSKIARHEILNDDPTYTALRSTVAHDTQRLDADRAGYTERFPGLAGEIAKVASDKAAVAVESTSALDDPNAFSPSEASTEQNYAMQLALVKGDQAQVAQLDTLIREERARLQDIPRLGADFAALRAERDAAAAELAALATRRANAVANRAEAIALGSVEVMDRAIKADTQLSGQRSLIAVAIVIFASVVAFALAFLVDMLDPRLRRSEQIEGLYGRPVIATFNR